MKKIFKSLIFTLLITVLCANTSFASMADAAQHEKTKESYSLIMAINEDIMVLNGAAYNMPSPVMAFDKTYVDVYALSYLLGIDVSWIDEAGNGYIKASAGANSQSFTYAKDWNAVSLANNSFFVKDNRMYVPLRALSDRKSLFRKNSGLERGEHLSSCFQMRHTHFHQGWS